MIPVVLIVPASTFVMSKFWAFRGPGRSAAHRSAKPARTRPTAPPTERRAPREHERRAMLFRANSFAAREPTL